MIFNSLISFITNGIAVILQLLPNADSATTTAISSSLSSFKSILAQVNWFFPVDTALQFLAIIFTIEAGIFLWKMIRYIAGLFTMGITK